MSSPAGWYPDPGGQRGQFRYWDGQTWSAQLSPTPAAPPPAFGAAGRPGPQQTGRPVQKQRRNLGPLIALLVGLVALGVLAFFVIRAVSNVGGLGGPTDPGRTNASTNPCPVVKDQGTPRPKPNDGRVHGGQLSYPLLGSPWGPVQPDDRLPFGRDVQTQNLMVEENYSPGQNWVASVLVAELVAGDGFFTPQQGSEIVTRCVVGKFYGNAQVGREDRVSKATTVDGKDAWLTEMHLTFDIKNLKTKGELAIIMIVATSPESSSIYYASIPDTTPQYVETARETMAQLKVSA